MVDSTLPVNGIELCVETFGESTDPPLLLIAGAASSMDWWEDEFCRRLAACGRYVIRYDHRDTGRSTSFPPGLPPYSGVDLAHDALGVLDVLGVHRAHLVGLSMGGALAQRIAVERPHRVLSLTLMSTSPGLGSADAFSPAGPPAGPPAAPPAAPSAGLPAAPPAGLPAAPPAGLPAAPSAGPPAAPSAALPAAPSAALPAAPPAGLPAGPAVGPPAAPPAPAPESTEALLAEPDWSDRRTCVNRLIESAQELGGPFTADEPHLRRLAERIFDRTTDMAATQTNHFCCADGTPYRHLLGTITAPTLILHGTQDPFFPSPHAYALEAEIPGARLVWLEGVGHEFPPVAVWSQVIAEIIGQAARGRQPA
ncbi:alpha/beta fold hydrolase [Actinoplanes sp. NPDC051513]|uniref:alpha/beta fold hydrolase n=1 Tax=Actinoplanes sp. NPDC051513 TaxID=3363908 RepID=UPI00379F9DBC